MIEILGTRLIAPYFGSSIYVWSALILVTMVALALGYWLGGLWADKHPQLSTLCAILLGAGIFTFLLPWLSTPLLSRLFGGGLVAMVLISAFVLFTPSLFLLGVVSPFVVRLRSLSREQIGLTVGSIYAVSTLGSIFGALLAGFILIPVFGVKKLFFLAALPLILLAAWGFKRSGHRKAAIIALIILLLPLLGLFWPAAAHQTPRFNFLHRPRISLLESRDSQYASLKVVRVQSPIAVNLCLLMDGIMQTAVMKNQIISRGDSLKIGNRLELLPFFNPNGRKALLIGLGGGLQARILGNYGIKVDAVEIDPQVAKLARKYFGFQGPCAIEDGRYYLRKTHEKYDFIVVDVLQGESLANYLFSGEMYDLCRRHLNPGGVLALNSLGWPGRSRVSDIIEHTLNRQFPWVKVYQSLAQDTPQVVTFFASNSPLQARPYGWGVSPGLLAQAENLRYYPVPTKQLITDYNNPAASEWAFLAYEWRKQNRRFFSSAVWDY